MISNATDIGRWFGDSGNSHDAAIVIAVSPMQSHAQCFFDNGNIIGFWILDLSNNTVQGPCRALLVDIAPADQQSLGSSFFSVMLGIPYCVHSVVTAIYRYWKSNRLFYWPFATYQVHALLWYRRTRPF